MSETVEIGVVAKANDVESDSSNAQNFVYNHLAALYVPTTTHALQNQVLYSVPRYDSTSYQQRQQQQQQPYYGQQQLSTTI